MRPRSRPTRAGAWTPPRNAAYLPGGATGGGFSFYVDKLAGSDANPGTLAEPFETVAAAISATADGDSIGLARGGEWREELFTDALESVEVGAYGSGALPVVDGADVLSGWSKTAGLTNVYEATTSEAVHTNGLYIVWEDGASLLKQASTAAVDATAGTYYVDEGGANPVFYVHATGSGDPASNGSTYEANVRRFAVSMTDLGISTENNTLSDVVAKRPYHNDGAIRIGPRATVSRVVAAQGHKHNLLIGSGLVEDAVLFGVDRNAVANSPFIGYYDAGVTGENLLPITAKRVFIIGDPVPPATYVGQVAMDNHVTGGQHGAVYVEGLAIKDLTSAYFFNAGTGRPTYKGVYLDRTTSIGSNLVQHIDVSCCMVNGKSVGTTGWSNVDLTNVVSYLGCQIWRSNGATYTGIAFIDLITTHYGSAGQFACSENLTMNRAVLAVEVVANQVCLSANAANYSGDHNVFYTKGTNEVGIWNRSEGVLGTFITTLAGWQAASGADANSVFLTAAQYAAFWLGSPAAGDFRINPAAQVTGADGTIYTGEFPDGTPITAAGPQAHWDWNARAEAAGPPTAWPTIPTTMAESIAYAADPEGWEFYP